MPRKPTHEWLTNRIQELEREQARLKRTEEALRRSEKEATRLARENAIIAEIGSIINSSLDIEDVYEHFAEAVRELLPFDRISINLVDLKENCTRIAYVSGGSIPGRAKGDRVSLERSASRAAIETRKSILISGGEPNEVAERFPTFLPTIQAGYQSILSVPLISKGEVVALLFFVSRRPNAYAEEEVRLGERVGYQITSAIVNARAFADLRRAERTAQEGERRLKELYDSAVQEIAHRKRAEAALKESEERFRSLFDEAPIGYHEIDTRGGITRVNRTELAMLGYTAEEMLDRPVWEFISPPDESRRAALDKLAGKRGVGTPFERNYRRKDGTEIPVLISEQILRERAGGISGIRSTIQDITDRKRAEDALKESEEKYKALYEEAPVGYMEYDDQGLITNVNQRELEMLGYTTEEMVGQPAWNLVEEKEKGKELIQAKLAGREPPSKNLERTYLRKDGTTFPALIQDVILRDRNGRIIGIRSTVQDISVRKRAEEEKNKLQAQLHQVQKMESVGRLAGGVAHDFNNMLQAILGHAEMASMALEEDHPVQSHLKEIQDTSQRSAAVVSQLLAFARKQAVSPKVLDLNDTVSAMLKMLRRLIGEAIALAWVPGHRLWRVKIDPTQVDQILVNLVVNARDAIAGVGRITIETRNVLLDPSYCAGHGECVPGAYVLLAVSDNGGGMSREVLDQLFEPFFTTKEIGKGTGLGLSTLYGIVKQNNGSVEVVSESGKGSSFKVYLPRFASEVLEERGAPHAEPLRMGTETVLLVEDEDSIRRAVQILLERLGYRVLSARTPGLALELAEQHEGDIDLLITDVVMPEMNGRDLAERLESLRPGMKNLFMSGYTADVIAPHGVLDKCVFFIQKPFLMMDLAAKVREVLESRARGVPLSFESSR